MSPPDADVIVDSGPNQISREDVERKIVVQANVAGRDLRSAVNEIQSPLAVVVLGGLLSATFLNMVVIPALCVRFYPQSLTHPPGR